MTSTMGLVIDYAEADANERYFFFNRGVPEEFQEAAKNKDTIRAALDQRIKELEANDRRYKWLRENHNLWGRIEMGHNGSYPERMDDAIDRAMSEAALTKLVDISQEYKLP